MHVIHDTHIYAQTDDYVLTFLLLRAAVLDLGPRGSSQMPKIAVGNVFSYRWYISRYISTYTIN